MTDNILSAYAMIDGGAEWGQTRRPLFTQRLITSGAAFDVNPFDAHIIINKSVSGATTCRLPPASQWMTLPSGVIPLLIKDGKGDAAVNNITLLPYGTDLIDGLPSLVIVSNFGSARICGLLSLDGWSSL